MLIESPEAFKLWLAKTLAPMWVNGCYVMLCPNSTWPVTSRQDTLRSTCLLAQEKVVTWRVGSTLRDTHDTCLLRARSNTAYVQVWRSLSDVIG